MLVKHLFYVSNKTSVELNKYRRLGNKKETASVLSLLWGKLERYARFERAAGLISSDFRRPTGLWLRNLSPI